jgi:hypothetical protein
MTAMVVFKKQILTLRLDMESSKKISQNRLPIFWEIPNQLGKFLLTKKIKPASIKSMEPLPVNGFVGITNC